MPNPVLAVNDVQTVERRHQMANWRRRSTRWGQLAVVVMMMLAAIGAWEIVKGMAKLGGYAQADGVVADHLTCYDVQVVSDPKPAGSDPKVTVQLRDQFSPTGINAVVRNIRTLCTPAIKTVISTP